MVSLDIFFSTLGKVGIYMIAITEYLANPSTFKNRNLSEL